MFEKRSKELGTYMLLGIKKKEIAHLVVIENILSVSYTHLSREGKIHALQIATESSIRSMQEQSKKLVTGKMCIRDRPY